MAEIGIKKAALYNAIAKYVSAAVQLGVTMVLSRLILPESYGVVAITTVLLGFLNLFADMGLGINVIQHPDMDKTDINRLFSFSLIVGVVLGLITALASYPLAKVYNEPLYRILCPLLSVVSFLNAANVVPNAILMRDKHFKAISARTILCSLVSGIIAVILALFGMGIYVLIIQSIISQLFLFIWNYNYTSLTITVFKTKAIIKLLGSYSLFQVLFNSLNYFTRNLDNLVIGKYFGSVPLAQYNKSYQLYLYPNTLFVAVLTGVLHPYLRDYKDDIGKTYDKYLQIVKALSIIGVFTMIVLFTCSYEIVLIMFGNNWGSAGTYLRCLSLCMWTQMMSSVSGSIFLGLERTDQVFKCGIINLGFVLLSIIAGVLSNSLLVLSLCIGISYNLIFLTTNIILVKQTMHLSLKCFLNNLLSDGAFAFGFVLLAFFLPDFSESVFVSLIAKLTLCTVSYMLYLTLSKQWNIILAVKGMFKC